MRKSALEAEQHVHGRPRYPELLRQASNVVTSFKASRVGRTIEVNASRKFVSSGMGIEIVLQYDCGLATVFDTLDQAIGGLLGDLPIGTRFCPPSGSGIACLAEKPLRPAAPRASRTASPQWSGTRRSRCRPYLRARAVTGSFEMLQPNSGACMGDADIGCVGRHDREKEEGLPINPAHSKHGIDRRTP